jgi:hypothetical protein
LRKLYLTINVNCEDDYFQRFGGLEKMNYGDIIRSKSNFSDVGELSDKRVEIIAETVAEHENDLLLAFAIRKKGQLSHIIKLISNIDITISRIFYDNGFRKETELSKYRNNYKLHSNWMDYSPEYVENTYVEFDRIIEDIKIEAKDNNIDIEAI